MFWTSTRPRVCAARWRPRFKAGAPSSPRPGAHTAQRGRFWARCRGPRPEHVLTQLASSESKSDPIPYPCCEPRVRTPLSRPQRMDLCGGVENRECFERGYGMGSHFFACAFWRRREPRFTRPLSTARRGQNFAPAGTRSSHAARYATRCLTAGLSVVPLGLSVAGREVARVNSLGTGWGPLWVRNRVACGRPELSAGSQVRVLGGGPLLRVRNEKPHGGSHRGCRLRCSRDCHVPGKNPAGEPNAGADVPAAEFLLRQSRSFLVE